MRLVVKLDEKKRAPWYYATLVAGLVMSLGLGTAYAQEGEEFEIPAEEEPDDDERPTLGAAEAPRTQARDFVEQRQFEGLQLADEAIVRLRDLAANTPVDDPDRAEYLYNLAGKYWGRSSHYENQSIEMQDECFLLEDEGDAQGARRCRFRVEDMKEEANRLRQESIDIYIEIIRHYPHFDELDTIYYQLGANMMQMGEQEEGLEIFRRLLAEFPQTEYMPHVLLYFGDYYFDEGELFDALDAYQKVVE